MGEIIKLEDSKESPFTEQRVLKMEIGDGLSIYMPSDPDTWTTRVDILRIPGGWLYSMMDADNDGQPYTRSTVFVSERIVSGACNG
jgi:hypothetical protein